MNKATTDELIYRTQAGDAAALHELIDAFASRLYGFLYRLVGKRDTAEELLQETFLRMVRKLPKYLHEGRFEPWLFTIAGNVARDHARKKRGKPEETRLDELMSEDSDQEEEQDALLDKGAESDPAWRIDRAEDSAALQRALDRLPEVEREVLVMRHYSGMNFTEIAKLLEMPVGTALARAHRGLNRLKTSMTAEGTARNLK